MPSPMADRSGILPPALRLHKVILDAAARAACRGAVQRRRHDDIRGSNAGRSVAKLARARTWRAIAAGNRRQRGLQATPGCLQDRTKPRTGRLDRSAAGQRLLEQPNRTDLDLADALRACRLPDRHGPAASAGNENQYEPTHDHARSDRAGNHYQRSVTHRRHSGNLNRQRDIRRACGATRGPDAQLRQSVRHSFSERLTPAP